MMNLIRSAAVCSCISTPGRRASPWTWKIHPVRICCANWFPALTWWCTTALRPTPSPPDWIVAPCIAANPDVIVIAVTPFGSSGPYADYHAGHLAVFHAGGEGWLLPNGVALDTFPDRPPIVAGANMGDYQAGLTRRRGRAGRRVQPPGRHGGHARTGGRCFGAGGAAIRGLYAHPAARVGGHHRDALLPLLPRRRRPAGVRRLRGVADPGAAPVRGPAGLHGQPRLGIARDVQRPRPPTAPS